MNPAKMADGRPKSLAELLKPVSRSFYKTLRVLPATVRPQIGLAYLLARTTDTIADTQLVPLEGRLHALQQLRDRIAGVSSTPLDVASFALQQGSPAERILLEQCENSLQQLASLSAPDQRLVRELLAIISSGQELDLRRFAGASAQQIIALRTDAELDDYTYRVAGCVGEFWTKMCRANVFPQAELDDSFLLTNGVRFGKGLQLVNILRDLAADLRQGRCYLPEERLRETGLTAQQLVEAGAEPRLRPLYNDYLDRAEAHLAAGWAYTIALPWRYARVRLACAWPILIGLETLKLLRTANVLSSANPLKVSREQVKLLIRRSVILYPWVGAWKRQAALPTT